MRNFLTLLLAAFLFSTAGYNAKATQKNKTECDVGFATPGKVAVQLNTFKSATVSVIPVGISEESTLTGLSASTTCSAYQAIEQEVQYVRLFSIEKQNQNILLAIKSFKPTRNLRLCSYELIKFHYLC